MGINNPVNPVCGVEQVKYQIPGATGISLQLQMITLLGDAAAAGFTINLFNAQPIMSWPEPGCMALAMVLMKNTLMRIAVLSANCQSGVWKSSSLGSFQRTYGNSACGEHGVSKAVCPSGQRVISGGWTLSGWSGNDGRNAPDSSQPISENTWQIVTGGGNSGGQCLRAVAYCADN